MPEQPTRFLELLRVLEAYGVQYVVVGAMAAAVQGAPISTLDIDSVHRRDPANVARLVAALRSVNAYRWEHFGQRPEPEQGALRLAGHHLLQADLGRIDVLGQVGADQGFEELGPHARSLEVASGVSVAVLDLEEVIATKRATGRPKDLAMLPVLEETLREIRRLDGDAPAGEPGA